MKRKWFTPILAAGAVAILALALVGGPAAAKSRNDGRHSFHGTVASIAKNGGALTINRTGGSQVRFVVRASTTYEHISGLSQLSKGTPVEVKAVASNGKWIATKIEANPGGSGGGHGADDPPGDDHGSGGHGSDD
ncbi:MAG: hypothetical protein JJE35_01720 [Thermoleophilia bacterium]|nr:hypothetical protein [Thermoleophilia bacterium]